jgi:ssDNA-binding replication factor A large subunit
MMKVVSEDIFYEAKMQSTIQSVSDINSNKGPIGNLLRIISGNKPVARQ